MKLSKIFILISLTFLLLGWDFHTSPDKWKKPRRWISDIEDKQEAVDISEFFKLEKVKTNKKYTRF